MRLSQKLSSSGANLGGQRFAHLCLISPVGWRVPGPHAACGECETSGWFIYFKLGWFKDKKETPGTD